MTHELLEVLIKHVPITSHPNFQVSLPVNISTTFFAIFPSRLATHVRPLQGWPKKPELGKFSMPILGSEGHFSRSPSDLWFSPPPWCTQFRTGLRRCQPQNIKQLLYKFVKITTKNMHHCDIGRRMLSLGTAVYSFIMWASKPPGLILAASSYTAYLDLRVQLARGRWFFPGGWLVQTWWC